MSELNEVLVSLEEVQEQIKMGELLEQLHRSPAFKKLIGEGYFKTEAQALVGMMAHPMQDMAKQQIQSKMIGISALQSYFNMIHRKSETAKASLLEHNIAIEEISAED